MLKQAASLLRSITTLDGLTVEEIIEHAESSHDLGQQIKHKILSRLEIFGDPAENLEKLFRTIDKDGSGVLRYAN